MPPAKVAAVGAHGVARRERRRLGRRPGRFHADDHRLQPQGVARRDEAADFRTLVDRNAERVEISPLVEQLERVGGDADHEVAAGGGHEPEPARFGEPVGLFARRRARRKTRGFTLRYRGRRRGPNRSVGLCRFVVLWVRDGSRRRSGRRSGDVGVEKRTKLCGNPTRGHPGVTRGAGKFAG